MRAQASRTLTGWKPWRYRGRIEDCSALTAGLVCSVTPARMLLRLARSGRVYCSQRRCYSTLQRNLAEVRERLDKRQSLPGSAPRHNAEGLERGKTPPFVSSVDCSSDVRLAPEVRAR